MHGASLSTYQYCPCSREQACPAHHSLGSLNLWQTKYYCKAVGGFQLHSQSTKSNSEAFLSREPHIPDTRMHRAVNILWQGRRFDQHFHTHLQPPVLLMFTRLFWGPGSLIHLWTAFSGHPSSAQSREGESCSDSKFCFPQNCPGMMLPQKAADPQVHYWVIQENIKIIYAWGPLQIPGQRKSLHEGEWCCPPQCPLPLAQRVKDSRTHTKESPACVMVQQKHLIHTYHPLKKLSRRH